MGGTSKKRPSLYLHEVWTRCNKVSPRTLQTAFVCRLIDLLPRRDSLCFPPENSGTAP
jgi:hypothetical protein